MNTTYNNSEYIVQNHNREIYLHILIILFFTKLFLLFNNW